MSMSRKTDTSINKDTFRSLAEILLGFWERHEKEWEANGYDHSKKVTQLKEKVGNLKGGDAYAKTNIQEPCATR